MFEMPLASYQNQPGIDVNLAIYFFLRWFRFHSRASQFIFFPISIHDWLTLRLYTILYASNLNYFYIIPGVPGDCWDGIAIAVEFVFCYIQRCLMSPCGDIILHVNNEMKRISPRWKKLPWSHNATSAKMQEPSLISIFVWLNYSPGWFTVFSFWEGLDESETFVMAFSIPSISF